MITAPSPRTTHTDSFSVNTLRDYTHATPFLLMDLDRVVAAYQVFREHLPQVGVHYAMKCNPDQRILERLHQAGCGFEIASLSELQQLIATGVRPLDVLFSNPVKMPEHIAETYAAGLRIYSADSVPELQKLARLAPGSKVNVRLRTQEASSTVASEGKFGVDAKQAEELLVQAAGLGLEPYGIAFHVGSQMHDPGAWDTAIGQSTRLMRQLWLQGIRLRMLDMGGGFPAHYSDAVPDLAVFADAIQRSLNQHLPYDVALTIEPGRSLVGDAGVMVSTVIGRAERAGRTWIHLDVGAFNGMMEALETSNSLMFPLQDSKNSMHKTLCHLTGPSCDSQDTIMYNVRLSHDLDIGDKVYIHTAGAYTTSYASQFNGFAIPITHYV